MADRYRVLDLFCEDNGHATFFRPLVARLAMDEGVQMPEIRERSARGGHGRALSQLRAWLRAGLQERADLLVVMIDANGAGWNGRRSEILTLVHDSGYPACVVGCPDPEVEAWCLADPPALWRALRSSEARALGTTRDPKHVLREAYEAAGVPVLGGLVAIAIDLVPEMDLYAAGGQSPSLRHFVSDLRAAFRAWRA